jgi:hypothetical protein
VSASPGSTGKDRPGHSAASGSSPSNGTGLSRSNGAKPSSSGANSTVSSASEPDGVTVVSASAGGDTDDATTQVESSAGSAVGASSGLLSAASAGSSAKTAGGAGTPPLGTPTFKDEQAKDPSSPWSTSAEPSGPAFADRTAGTAGPAKPAAKPFGAGESAVGASSAPASAQPGSSGSAGAAFRDRVNDVIRPGKASAGSKSPRKAHLQVSRLEPWSVMKFSFVMSLVCFIVLLVAVAVIYMILSGLGVFDQIVQTINELTQDKNAAKSSTFDAASWFSFTRIFGYAALVGALNVLLITALATVWSVIYNIAADFVGGIEVTLKEAE